MPHLAAIGLGSNLGDRAANLAAAVEAMGRLGDTRVVAVSANLENPAVGGPAGSPAFLNAAAVLQTTFTPSELLAGMLEIEAGMGRHRLVKWEPRPIDLDLILYDDLIVGDPWLVVPHPLMHRRRFVLQPLASVAPDWVHPLLHKTVSQLLAELT